MGKRLVILSVPYQRLIRVLLSDYILNKLCEQADVLIISPFALNPTFQKDFNDESIHFLQWTAPEKMKKPLGWLYIVSESLRTLGYWRRHGKKGMEYSLANIYVQLGFDGDDKKISFFKRVIFYMLSIIGVWSGAWRVIDRLIGPSLFNFPALQNFAHDYKQVTLIQSANWGMQDRMLAWMGREERWRTTLIPYTTDQLYCNGYLISDFNAVCVQGTAEDGFARELHNLPSSRIKHLGSVWFRHIEQINKSLSLVKDSNKSGIRKILYAGVSNRYFPRSSEYLGLEILLNACSTGELNNVHIIYRPLGETAEIRNEINERYHNTPNLTIQYAQRSCFGLEEFCDGPNSEGLREYIGQLIEVDILVMCLVTSLMLDLASVGIPTVCNMVDPTNVLAKRNTQLFFNKEGRFDIFESVPVIHNQTDLVPAINELLNDKEKATDQVRQVASQWDYPKANFQNILLESVFGE